LLGLSDQRLKTEIVRVQRDNFGVYGIEKVWRQLWTRPRSSRVRTLMAPRGAKAWRVGTWMKARPINNGPLSVLAVSRRVVTMCDGCA